MFFSGDECLTSDDEPQTLQKPQDWRIQTHKDLVGEIAVNDFKNKVYAGVVL